MKHTRIVAPFLLATLIACAAPTPTPAPSTPLPPAPTFATSPTPQPTPTPTYAPPTATPAPPTPTTAPTATQTLAPTPTPTPLAALDGVFFSEINTASGKAFSFLRFFADGNVVLNNVRAADAPSAWNSVRPLTPDTPNLGTGKYTFRGKEIAFTLSNRGDPVLEYAGTIEGNRLILTEKWVPTGVTTQNVTFTRADFAR
ncbi:MAG: hypothetical protein HY327_11125 [Chloroflexi bacterium]|nr:hypothetical protein [Chloroflexota bacterium]